jgi:glyoxylase-like metal-dependent hydrolase (beta-lactamase superfamily II)
VSGRTAGGRRPSPAPQEIAPDVYLVALGRGAAASNVYLVRWGSSWALVDAGWSSSAAVIRTAAEAVFGPGTRPAAILLTHIHPDHSGSAGRLARSWRVPVYVHPDELPMAAGRYLPQYSMPLDRWLVIPLMRLLPAGTRARIEAANSITDVVRPLDPQGGAPGLPEWRWVSTVGHTPGHAAYLRPRDGVLIAGDAALTVDLNSGRRGAGWPAAGGRPAVVHDLGLAGGQAVGRSAGGVGTACAAAGARTTPDRRDGHRAARAGLVSMERPAPFRR